MHVTPHTWPTLSRNRKSLGPASAIVLGSLFNYRFANSTFGALSLEPCLDPRGKEGCRVLEMMPPLHFHTLTHTRPQCLFLNWFPHCRLASAAQRVPSLHAPSLNSCPAFSAWTSGSGLCARCCLRAHACPAQRVQLRRTTRREKRLELKSIASFGQQLCLSFVNNRSGSHSASELRGRREGRRRERRGEREREGVAAAQLQW